VVGAAEGADLILVTGTGGQLGRALCETLGDRAVGLPRSRLDITDAARVRAVVEDLRPFAIVNAAAFTDVDRAESEPDEAAAVNASGAAHVAAAAALTGAFLVHVSTDAVFDGRLGRPYREDDEPNPLSVYASTKLEGERLVLRAHPGAAVVRTAWVYAPWGRNFVRAILGAARGSGKPLQVVDDQVGSPTWVRDLAAGIVALLDRPVAGVFHVAGGGAVSRYEQARAILSSAGGDPSLVVPVHTADRPVPAVRPAFSPLEPAAWTAAGFAPLRPWREALDAAMPEVLAG
jgi:dTDP-4-dehydrorhamnose reductase